MFTSSPLSAVGAGQGAELHPSQFIRTSAAAGNKVNENRGYLQENKSKECRKAALRETVELRTNSQNQNDKTLMMSKGKFFSITDAPDKIGKIETESNKLTVCLVSLGLLL